ncbi:MAG: hypothetical protein LBT23_10550 [Synergistaceae bacterium]|jgi:hypothetical protein|nr:hypothetical protein [Synergistaceae bacterium]
MSKYKNPATLPEPGTEPLVYCGPSLPGARLVTMSVFKGGLPPRVTALIEGKPEIGRMIVPASRVHETRSRASIQGTEENRLYQAILTTRGETANGV